VQDDLLSAAHAVFLPAFDHWDFDHVMAPFLQAGGCSILVGESRTEYVQRRMSDARRSAESGSSFRDSLDRLRARTEKLIVAVDEELGGIRRLEGLVPDLPTLAAAQGMADAEIEARCLENAASARALGVTMYLAPIVDVVDGENPWLQGRTLGRDIDQVARIGAAFVRGVQRGGIAATTKHFPGFNHMDADPALTDVTLGTALDRLRTNAKPFAAAIAAGTKAIMVGPAPVGALDRTNAACVSPAVIGMLRSEFGFTGLIVSDDLDAPATLRGRSLLDVAIGSLEAGADLLLVAGGPSLGALCQGVASAAAAGRLSPDRLIASAERVRAHAEAWG